MQVEKQLAGKAYCARLATSKCVADPAFLDEVQLLLKQYRFAVIHFNNGLHGFGYTEDQYRSGLVGLDGDVPETCTRCQAHLGLKHPYS